MPWWWFLLVILIVAAALAALAFARRSGTAAAGAAPLWFSRGRPDATADAAIAELRLRYARGEVGRDDFVQISSDLAATGTEPPAAEVV